MVQPKDATPDGESDKNNQKVVCVELDQPGARKRNYEVSFISVAKVTDLLLLEQNLAKKFKPLRGYSEQGKVSFMIESQVFKGKWMELSDESEINHLASVKCFVDHSAEPSVLPLKQTQNLHDYGNIFFDFSSYNIFYFFPFLLVLIVDESLTPDEISNAINDSNYYYF